MKQLSIVLAFALVAGFQPGFASAGSEKKSGPVLEESDRTTSSVKKSGRRSLEKTCEEVNGRLHCFPVKGDHKLKEATENVIIKEEDMKR